MPKRNSNDTLLLRRRRKLREVTSAFRFLIATPHDLGTGPLVMPGPGRLALSHTAALAQGEVTISVEGGRSWTTKALVADAKALGNHADDNARITQVGASVGTLSLFVQNPLNGTFALIATQIISG